MDVVRDSRAVEVDQASHSRTLALVPESSVALRYGTAIRRHFLSGLFQVVCIFLQGTLPKVLDFT